MNAENLVGPNTISDPDANANSKQFNAFLYNRRIILRELQHSPSVSGLERLGWTPAQVGKAKGIFERIYRHRYEKDGHDGPLAEPAQARGRGRPGGRTQSPTPLDDVDPFQQLFGPEPGAREPVRQRSETAQWLEEPPEPWNVDGIEWWKLYGQRYPRGLADMAWDYLSIPASSVPAERLFSRAGNPEFPLLC
jgi:hypothetical protein